MNRWTENTIVPTVELISPPKKVGRIGSNRLQTPDSGVLNLDFMFHCLHHQLLSTHDKHADRKEMSNMFDLTILKYVVI